MVVDEQDRCAGLFEFSHVAKQLVDFLGDEYGGWLVKDQDVRTPEQHLDYLDALAFTDFELFDEIVRVDGEPIGGAEFAQVFLGLSEVDAAEGLRGFGSQDDVL